MDAQDRLLGLSPTLLSALTAVSEQEGSVELTLARHEQDGPRLRLSRLEWELAQRFDGTATVRHVLQAVRAQGGVVSPQALASLCTQLADAGLLQGWPRTTSSPPYVPSAQQIDRAEEADMQRDAEVASRLGGGRSAAALAQAAQKMLLSVGVEEGELAAMARQAIALLRQGDRARAAEVMRAASALAPPTSHWGLWAQEFDGAAATPARAPTEVLQRVYAAAPEAARRLYSAPGSTGGKPGATHGPGSAVVPAPSAAWYEPEGTMGLDRPFDSLERPLADARRWATAAGTRRLRKQIAAAVVSIVALLAAGTLLAEWSRPTVVPFLVAPAPYRTSVAARPAALSWPQSVVVRAPVAGTVAAVAPVGTKVPAAASIAQLAPAAAAAASGGLQARALARRAARWRHQIGRAHV